jgi:hypothetical protein
MHETFVLKNTGICVFQDNDLVPQESSKELDVHNYHLTE